MAKTLLMVHGHGFKPAQQSLASLWHDALRAGLERDYPEKLAGFDAIESEMAYFGDLGNQLLAGHGQVYDEHLDVVDRRNAFAALRSVTKAKKFNRYQYQQLPGKTALKEMLADVGAPVLGKLGLADTVLARVAPEIVEYWRADSDFRAALLKRVLGTLTPVMDRDDEILLVAHGLGAVVAYDALWELSRGADLSGRYGNRKVAAFLTLGSPLGDNTVRGKLAGAGVKGADAYPANVLVWNNVAAEDDYVCHDKTLADDFAPMLRHHLVSAICDFRIYNHAVRYSRSNPHSSIGYLVHPRVTKLLAEWL